MQTLKQISESVDRNQRTHSNGLTPLDQRNGFTRSFGVTTRATEIAVYIVCDYHSHSPRYGVYIQHGVAGGRFWRNAPPLAYCESMDAARDVAETIFGVAGSGGFAEVVER